MMTHHPRTPALGSSIRPDGSGYIAIREFLLVIILMIVWSAASHAAGLRWQVDGMDGIWSSREAAARAMADRTCATQVSPGGWTSCEVLSVELRPVVDIYRFGDSPNFNYTFRSFLARHCDTFNQCYPDSYFTLTHGRSTRAVPVVDRFHYDNVSQCPRYGNPIFPLSGLKRQEIAIYPVIAGVDFNLYYDTRSFIEPPADTSLPVGTFGKAWYSSLHREVQVSNYVGGVAEVRFHRGDGSSTNFALSAGQLVANPGVVDAIAKSASGWRYYDQNAKVIESYDQSGKILSSASVAGGALTYYYSAASHISQTIPSVGLIMFVRDHFGRQISFEYQQPLPNFSPRIAAIIDPAGLRTSVLYDDSGNLERLQWPDGNEYKMLYERPDLQWALSGIVDENGQRISDYLYSQYGLAISTARAGGVDRHEVAYTTPPSFRVSEQFEPAIPMVWRDHYWQPPVGTMLTMPNGQASEIASESFGGTPKVIGQSQPAGSGCGAATSYQSFDQVGNATQIDDFIGNRSCYSYAAGRRLEISRIEGLNNSTSCADVMPAGSVIPAGSRRTTRQWHPDWRLESKVAEPGRIITHVYNGQPDPFNSNTVASCAPAAALLPDGKPIVVRCRSVEQATTDTSGALGFSAALQSSVAKREQKWTYNQFGQVLTHDGPRTDVSDITVFSYYSDTTASHTLGDLASITNAAGRATAFTIYDKHGQLLESVDPNGVVTSNIYDLRRRLLSASVGGHSTSYAYDAAGQLARLTLPGGQWFGYEYDAAHRQQAVYDSLGNRIEYTLDNAGNRTAERVKDTGGVLRRQLLRSMDALGRVQQTIGRN